MLLTTLKNTRHGSPLGNERGGFCIVTVEHPSPGSFIMKYKHGLINHPLYVRWERIKDRCFNANYSQYHYYGGRGITLYSKWKYDFKSFCDYMMKLPNALEDGYSIDRINNDKGYFPENLRWTTMHMQAVNSRMKNTNKSGYVGVSWYNNTLGWSSYIYVDNKKYHLGYYINILNAVNARNAYIIDNNLSEYPLQ